MSEHESASAPERRELGRPTLYERFGKRAVDIVLSLAGMLLLSWLCLLVAIIIFIDDPGPVIFAQKRVGKGKNHFTLHKFRSMKRSAPSEVATHLLKHPGQYTTRVGRYIRKYSLDELPQLWDIFVGNMSVIGPRPALWNQFDLIAERDKYAANDVLPGLTGWAQINGRDELKIATKARLDGEYVKALRKSSLSGLAMDLRCFFGSFIPVLRHDGFREGAPGATKKADKKSNEQR